MCRLREYRMALKNVAMKKSHRSITLLYVCADPLMPITGGAASRVFMMIDYLRREGFRVELVTVDNGAENNRRIGARVVA